MDYLTRWIKERAEWIDSQGFPAPEMQLVSKNDRWAIALSCKVGIIHYTLDGNDPRQSGGITSPEAEAYTIPITLQAGQNLVARVRSPFGIWSPPLQMNYDQLAAGTPQAQTPPK